MEINCLNRLSELVESIAKKPIPPHVKALTLEMVVNDRDGEDVEVNYRTFLLVTLGKKLTLI